MARVARVSTTPQRILTPKEKPFKIRVGGAHQPREEGFIGIDEVETESVDYLVNLGHMPWPIDDSVVDFVHSANYLQRLSGHERIAFMNETWRILKPGAQMSIIAPHWSSMRAVSDPLTVWPPLCEGSFVYFNKEWREREKKDYGMIICDFDYGYGFGLDPDIQVRNEEYQRQAIKHWNNAALDLHVTMTARK